MQGVRMLKLRDDDRSETGGWQVMDRTFDDVARRAYELFLARGREHGRDLDDWLEAERQVMTVQPPTRAARRTTSAPRTSRTTARARAR
jgi:hypothetical protein